MLFNMWKRSNTLWNIILRGFPASAVLKTTQLEMFLGEDLNLKDFVGQRAINAGTGMRGRYGRPSSGIILLCSRIDQGQGHKSDV